MPCSVGYHTYVPWHTVHVIGMSHGCHMTYSVGHVLYSKFLHPTAIHLSQNTHNPCLLPCSRRSIHQHVREVITLDLGKQESVYTIKCLRLRTGSEYIVY